MSRNNRTVILVSTVIVSILGVLPTGCGTGIPVPNTDSDGSGDGGSGAPVSDRDADGIADTEDNCPDVANPEQPDVDGNGIGDSCENAGGDDDGDGGFDDGSGGSDDGVGGDAGANEVAYWVNVFGGTAESVQDIHAMEYDEYVVLAELSQPGDPYLDDLVALLDQRGDIQWQTVIGGDIGDTLESIQPEVNGGYILGGRTKALGNGDFDGLLVWLDGSGNAVSQLAVGGEGDDFFLTVLPEPGGGYVLMGNTDSGGSGEDKIFLAGLDESGSILWQRTLRGSHPVCASDMVETSDGGLILVGSIEPSGDREEILAVKLDVEANILWAKAFGLPGERLRLGLGRSDRKGLVHPTSDGGCVIGAKGTSSIDHVDALILRLDGAGNIEWQYSFWTEGKGLYPTSVSGTSTGGSVLTAYTMDLATFAPASVDTYVLNLDAEGDTIWQRVFGRPSSADMLLCIKETGDSGFILGGVTAGERGVVKTDSNGNIPGCPHLSEAETSRLPTSLETSLVSLSVAEATFTSSLVDLPVVASDLESVTVCNENGYSEEETPGDDGGDPIIVGCNSVMYEGHLFTNIGCEPGIASFDIATTQDGHTASFHVECSFAGCVSAVW